MGKTCKNCPVSKLAKIVHSQNWKKCLNVCMSVYKTVCISVYETVCMSVYEGVSKIELTRSTQLKSMK